VQLCTKKCAPLTTDSNKVRLNVVYYQQLAALAQEMHLNDELIFFKKDTVQMNFFPH